MHIPQARSEVIEECDGEMSDDLFRMEPSTHLVSLLR